VAVVAGDQGLAVARGHLLHPGRDRSAAVPQEVFQVAHGVNLHAVLRAAQLAGVREQPFEHLRSGVPGSRRPVIEDCIDMPPERDASPSGYQRSLPVPFDPHLQPFAGTVWRLPRRAEPSVDPRIADAQLVPQCSDQAPLHGMPQQVEPMPVVGQLIVRRHAPVRLLELHHDAERGIVEAFGPGSGLAAAEVGTTLRANDVRGDAQADLAIGRAAVMPVARRIDGPDGDLVAEEPSSPGPRVREQGLGLGQFQLERVAPERPSACLIASASPSDPLNPRSTSSA
jgi:hypothetical protein